MIMKKIVFGIFLMIIVIGLTGCTQVRESPLDEGGFGLPFDLDKKQHANWDDDCSVSCSSGSCSIVCDGVAFCDCDENGMPICTCY